MSGCRARSVPDSSSSTGSNTTASEADPGVDIEIPDPTAEGSGTESKAESTKETTENPAATEESTATEKKSEMSIAKTSFGKTADGQEIDLYTCTNSNGLIAKFTSYGAIVVSLETPDRDGKLANINLGFDKLDLYLERHPYFGSTVGRFCNRIAKGKFTLDDKEYTLATNNDPNHLHGGDAGFDKQVWKAEEVETDEAVGVKFTRRSPDGEEGYPGNLDVTVVYTLTKDDELKVEFTATSDKATPCNLTNHNYWNLAGAGSGTIEEHEVQIESDKYLSVDDTLIPTGELADVKGTPLDFTTPHKLGERLKQIKADPVGYDHCFALRSQDGSLALAARVKEPGSGRVMEIYTTQPGIQLYTGNFLDGSEGNGGYNQYGAFCLETQHYPDSPNQPEFPSTILKPGETYSQTTIHKFSAE
jgi:aldose 1-epimerase